MAVSDKYDKIHADLYDKVNECTAACRALKSEINTLTGSMSAEISRYVELLHRQQDKQFRVVGGLVLVVIFCIGIIGYGAIGKQGMYTVRNTLPCGAPGDVAAEHPFIPPHDKGIPPQIAVSKNK